ncbi:MAG: MFS transporter [Candidatus Aenigmatarchaeota archaeon]
MPKYKKFIRNYYAYRFLKEFAFIYAVYVLLFKMAGLTLMDISMLLAIWSGFTLVFEVPSGALADKWNRKYMLILGLISKAVGFGIWIFANNFVMFALGFVCWGLGSAFYSGTQEALLFDNLRIFRKTGSYEKVIGRARFYSNLAIGTSVLLGGFIASYSFDLVLILSSLMMLAAIVPVLSFREIRAKKTPSEELKYFQLIKRAVKASLNNRTLMRMVFYSVVVFSFIGTLNEYEQLYFSWLDIPVSFFGVAAVTIIAVDAIGSRFAYKFKKRFDNVDFIYILSSLSGIFLIISVSFKTLLLMPFFILAFFFTSVGLVFSDAKLQREIRTHQRATIMSIKSFLSEGLAIGLIAVFGLVSQVGDLTWGFVTFGLIVIAFSVISLLTTPSRK